MNTQINPLITKVIVMPNGDAILAEDILSVKFYPAKPQYKWALNPKVVITCKATEALSLSFETKNEALKARDEIIHEWKEWQEQQLKLCLQRIFVL